MKLSVTSLHTGTYYPAAVGLVAMGAVARVWPLGWMGLQSFF